MIKLTNGLIADVSTLRLDRLQKCPQISGVSPWKSMGSGCFLDPPGFPSYFMRGYENRNNSGYAIQIGDMAYCVDGELANQGKGWIKPNWKKLGIPEDRKERLKWLYQPLPFENERVQVWIMALYMHLRHCYVNPEGERQADRLLIYPVQSTEYIKEGLFVASPGLEKSPFFFQHLSPKTQERALAMIADCMTEAEAQVARKRAALNERVGKLCTIDTHAAVVDVREVYPNFTGNQDFMDGKFGRTHAGDWYAVLAERPEPCPLGHLVPEKNLGFVCQYCGREDRPEREEGDKRIGMHFCYHNEVAVS